MRILFAAGGFGRGGKERRMISLMQYLARRGCELGIVADTGSPQLAEVSGICGRVFNYRRGDASYNLRQHRRGVREFSPEVLHCWSTSCVLFSILATIGQRCAIVSSEITDARPVGGFSREFLMTRVNFAWSDAIVSNSRAGIRAKRAPERKSRVIHNGFDFERIVAGEEDRRVKLEKPAALKVVMAARFCKEKDFSTLLRVAALVQEAGSGMMFFLAGDGPDLNETREAARRAGLRNVHFLGYHPCIDALLRKMDVGILVTDPRYHQEGISNSVMECMAHGLPVIVSDGPAVREIVDDEVDGYVVPPHDPDAIYGRLTLLEEDARLRREVGARAKDTVCNRFNLEQMGPQFMGLYAEVTKVHGKHEELEILERR